MVWTAGGRRLAAIGLAVSIVCGVAWPVAAATARIGVVSLALWSDQSVFRAEATQAARLLAARYHAAAVMVLSNTPAALAAGPKGMAAAIARVDRALDPDRDVLVVVMTSHGSPEGIAEKGGGTEGLLSPTSVSAMLQASPVRRKVLIVSACFSGIFAPLAMADLLVITAADADHPSFGCTAGASWTYFDRAFFDEALRQGTAAREPLAQVFAHAAALVRAREIAEGFDPSNPQIAGRADVLSTLDAIR